MSRTSIAVLAGVFAGAMALGDPAPAASASTAGCDGFNGRWITTWSGGTATLRVTGTQGTYDFDGGTVTGRIVDTVFAGAYSEADGYSGSFWFKLRRDGNSFKGWYATAGNPDRHLYWSGICLGSR